MAKASASPPKGTRDFLPRAVRQRRYAVGLIQQVYEAHGFEPLETPALERLDALTGKYGEEGDQLLFPVLLRGQPLVQGIRAAAEHLREPGALVTGRSGETAPRAAPLLSDMGLRYDLTVPLARAHAANQGSLPAVFKRYQIQPVWRADTPGKGRYREFYQCDLDVVGSGSPLVEAEVAGAGCECLERLGFSEFRLRTNHRGLLRSLVERAGIAAEREVDAIAALDKLDKVGKQGVASELSARGVAAESSERLLSLVVGGASLADVKGFLGEHEAGRRALRELEEVLSLCRYTAAAEHVAFDVTLARGLGYYTGTIFELSAPGYSGSVGGGGRYDGLIGMFSGKDVPACGLSLGLERLLLIMEEQGMFPPDLGALDVQLAFTSGEEPAAALAVARKLRGLGLSVSLSPKAEKPGKLRKAAAERQAAYAAWLERGSWHYWRSAGDEIARDLDEAALLSALGAREPS